MRNVLFIGGIVVAAGCKPPPEAPTELNDLSKYLFANYDAEDEEVVAVGIQNLDTFLGTQDLTADLNARSASLSILEGADLGTVPATEGADPAQQANVGAWALSAATFAVHKDSQSDPNQVCAASDSTKYSARTFVSDLAAWESGDARTLETTSESRTETMIADVWIDSVADFRMITLEDGREAMIQRAYMPAIAPADQADKSWDQRYTVDVWLPTTDGTGTLRYYAMWSSATIGVGGDTYAALVKGGIGEYFDNTDAWLIDQDCHTDRDRPYDRPQ